MKIAIDVSPISKNSDSAHKVRGVGSYINLLVENLPKFDKSNEYVFIEDKKFPSEVDLIHYPYFDPFFITLPLYSNKKFVVTVHDLTPLVYPAHFPAGIKGKARWLVQKSLLRQAKVVIADSNSSKKDVERIVGINPDKVRTIYLAADEKFVRLKTEDLRNVSKKFNLPEKFLLYVGDATWNKNLPKLVDAVKKTKYPLVMVGKVWPPAQRAPGPEGEISNNPWNRDLIDVHKHIDDDEQFVRLGFVETEDLVRIYNLAAALIMPSIYEGFGLPILEAMSSGCPVICSRGGSIPEVAQDAAAYVDEQSSESMESIIRQLMEDPKLSEKLSDKGIIQAKKFTLEKMIIETVASYKSA